MDHHDGDRRFIPRTEGWFRWRRHERKVSTRVQKPPTPGQTSSSGVREASSRDHLLEIRHPHPEFQFGFQFELELRDGFECGRRPLSARVQTSQTNPVTPMVVVLSGCDL